MKANALSNSKIQVYFMPGMAASPLIFENIKLPEDTFEMHFLEWLIPERHEPLVDYVKRLLKHIVHENPVLIGVSFGGVIVQEMAKLIPVRKLIIISSVKSTKEFPRRMHFAKTTGAHKLIPTSLVVNIDTLAKYSFGSVAKRLDIYKMYLSVNDKVYLDWALDTICTWKQEEPPENIVHIHGDKDSVFPIKYIENSIILAGGTHTMIINRFRWFSEQLPKIIKSIH